MKKCFKCNETKKLNQFYRHKMMADGHLGKCKECTKLDALLNRNANLSYYREYDRGRFMEPQRVEAREKYASSEAGKESRRLASVRWGRNNRHKRRAHLQLKRAIQKGLVERLPCSICGDPKSHGHHADYDKPLEVEWLCQKHHFSKHNFRKNDE